MQFMHLNQWLANMHQTNFLILIFILTMLRYSLLLVDQFLSSHPNIDIPYVYYPFFQRNQRDSSKVNILFRTICFVVLGSLWFRALNGLFSNCVIVQFLIVEHLQVQTSVCFSCVMPVILVAHFSILLLYCVQSFLFLQIRHGQTYDMYIQNCL